MRSTGLIVLLAVALVGCSKKENKPAESAAKSTEGSDPKKASGEVTAAVGVEAGGIERSADEGAAAVVTTVKGKVEIRRVGETEYKDAKANDKLYAGDAVRTGAESTADIALADESVIQLAEVTTVAIANRHASADPASGAAVLSGLARFTVTPRAPAEGAFRVYTSAGVVLTKGTVYGVGVAANGDARVGVEQGSVDVVGLAAVDATPVTVEAGNQVALDAKGTVTGQAAWPADDWGTWRDEIDAKVTVDAAVDAHAAAMAELDAQIKAAYADLDASADAVATFEASAAAAADKGDTAAYTAAVPDGAATIDASFSLAGRLEALTWAYAAHATLASDLYVRHPTVVEPKWAVVAPRVDAAVLWPKRYEVTATGYLEPLHTQYYVHHPRGRIHAELVGVVVPDFYTKITVPEIEPVRVRGRVKSKIWIAPDVRYVASTRPVWITAPSADWHAKIKVAPAAFRGNVGWYVRPATFKAKAIVATAPSATYVTKIKVGAPTPRASLRAAWKVPVGMKVKVAPPSWDVAAKARGSYKVGAGGAADVKGKVKVVVPEPPKVKVVVPDVKAKVGVGVKAGAGVAGDAKGKVDAGAKTVVKVKAPDVKVKVKAPEVKVKGKAEAKGKIKIGL